MVGKHKLTEAQVLRLISIYQREYDINNIKQFKEDVLNYKEGNDLARMLIRKYHNQGFSNEQIKIKLGLDNKFRGLIDSSIRTKNKCCNYRKLSC